MLFNPRLNGHRRGTFLIRSGKAQKIGATIISERLNFVPPAIDLAVELGACAIARKLLTRRSPAV